MLGTQGHAACCSQKLRFGTEPDLEQWGGGRCLLQVLVKVKQSDAHKVVSRTLANEWQVLAWLGKYLSGEPSGVKS